MSIDGPAAAAWVDASYLIHQHSRPNARQLIPSRRVLAALLLADEASAGQAATTAWRSRTSVCVCRFFRRPMKLPGDSLRCVWGKTFAETVNLCIDFIVCFSGSSSSSSSSSKKIKGTHIGLNGIPMTELRDVTCHMGSHSVTSTRHKWVRPALTPARRQVLDLPTPEG